MTVTGLPYGLRLEYRIPVNGGDWQQVEELVPFRRTATPFGGHRLWFTCLKCRKRCHVLYGGPPFRCRCCHGIRYSSQSENELHRAWRVTRSTRSNAHSTSGRAHVECPDEDPQDVLPQDNARTSCLVSTLPTQVVSSILL